MEICCLILNYNDSQTTIKLLSLISDYKVFSKVLVVDNCSTDQSFQIIQNYASRTDEKVRVIRTSENKGYGYGNNFGIQYIFEEWGISHVLLCNPDVEFDEDCITKLKEVFEKKPNCGIAAPIQLNAQGEKIKYQAWKIPTPFQYVITAETICSKLFSGFYYREEYYCSNELCCEVECIPGSMLLIDAQKFLECGGYDPDMFLYCEEVTLGYKMKFHNFKTFLVKNSQYIHKHSITINKSIPKAVNKKMILLKSRSIFLCKYLKVGSLYRCFAKIIYALAIAEEYGKGFIIKGRKNKC